MICEWEFSPSPAPSSAAACGAGLRQPLYRLSAAWLPQAAAGEAKGGSSPRSVL